MTSRALVVATNIYYYPINYSLLVVVILCDRAILGVFTGWKSCEWLKCLKE